MERPNATVSAERKWSGVLVELDRENATGKVRLDGDADSRVPVQITDPAFHTAGSPYMAAFAAGTSITMLGKAEIAEGTVRRIYISNTG